MVWLVFSLLLLAVAVTVSLSLSPFLYYFHHTLLYIHVFMRFVALRCSYHLMWYKQCCYFMCFSFRNSFDSRSPILALTVPLASYMCVCVCHGIGICAEYSAIDMSALERSFCNSNTSFRVYGLCNDVTPQLKVILYANTNC